jgi:hypothetical protein
MPDATSGVYAPNQFQIWYLSLVNTNNDQRLQALSYLIAPTPQSPFFISLICRLPLPQNGCPVLRELIYRNIAYASIKILDLFYM